MREHFNSMRLKCEVLMAKKIDHLVKDNEGTRLITVRSRNKH